MPEKQPKLCMYCHLPLGDEGHPDDAPEGHMECWWRRPDVRAILGRTAETTDQPSRPRKVTR